MTGLQKAFSTACRVVRAAPLTISRTAPGVLSTGTVSLGVAAMILNTACYSYLPRTTGQLVPGDHVMVALNDAGRDEFARLLGNDIASAEGDLISADASSVRMSVTNVVFTSASSAPRPGIRVTIPVADIDSTQAKKFSKAETSWLVALIAAGIVGLIKSGNVVGSGTIDNNTGKSGGSAGN